MRAALRRLRESKSVVGRERISQTLWSTEQERLSRLSEQIIVAAKGQMGGVCALPHTPEGNA